MNIRVYLFEFFPNIKYHPGNLSIGSTYEFGSPMVGFFCIRRMGLQNYRHIPHHLLPGVSVSVTGVI